MVSTASGIQFANQSTWQQFKLSQAERSADQAEQRAQSLRAQADSAQRRAIRAQENASSLQVEAGQAQVDAGEARRGVATLKSVEDAGARLGAVYDRLAQVKTPPVETADAAAVVNSQGEVTGQVVSEAV
jgi:hypothetical protein